MKMTQVYELLNDITKELLGDDAIVQEDLSNVVQLGEQYENVTGFDNYVRALNDHIGRMVFVNHVYGGRAPSVLMDGWEYGSIMEKVSAHLPDAQENESWELQDGASYDPHIFYKPSISVKFWNNRITFEIPISITERQVKSSFSNATQLNAFFSMIQTAIQNSMTVKLDALIMRTINNMVGETFYADYTSGSGYSDNSGTRAINLLKLYNDGPNSGNEPLTATQALTTPEFIRFASMMMANYIDRLAVISTRFNIGGMERFTTRDKLRVIMLSDFVTAAGSYLQSDTFHDMYTALPSADTVTYWQAPGENYDFSDVSSINVVTSGGHTVNVSGVLAVMFDRDALGVTNIDRRVTSDYNPKAEFTNFWHKYDAGYFNDTNENMLVFFVA